MVEGRIAARIIDRAAAVHELRASGRPLAGTARILDLDPETVRRFARATDAPALISAARQGCNILDAPSLRERASTPGV